MKATANNNSSQRDRLLAFYSGDDIILSAEEEAYRTRLNFTKTKLFDWNLSTEDIVGELRDSFGVSKYRAERDVADANYIFGKSLIIDKSLVAGQTVERIKQDIALIREAGKFDLLPKMYEALIKAAKELPADKSSQRNAPKLVMYSLHGNNTIAAPLPTAQVLQTARNQFKADFEDIEHEEVGGE